VVDSREPRTREALRVLLVDDHAVVRLGCRRLLEQVGGMCVVAEAASGEEGYRAFVEHTPDITVLDIVLPGIGGIETLRRIVARAPGARVLMFSLHESAVFASRALQAGACGYVTKSEPPAVLIDAVRCVASGRTYLSHGVAQDLAVQSLPGHGNPVLMLTPREFEVFRLTVEGRELADIARLMSLSPKTVANHQSIVRRKLGVTTLAQAVRLAATQGMLQTVAGAPTLERAVPPYASA
jgi:DNA-binding NarL/FixJ family response regulator